MGEIRLDHCCRLCLKEGFSLANIFSHRSATGYPLYRILSFIYDIKIDENDGLPSQICSPCMWRMIEFDACKRNVRSAEAEIMRLLNQTRPNRGGVSKDGLVKNDEETTMDGACEFEEEDIESDGVELEVPINEQLDIVESEVPREIVMQERASEVEASENGYADNMLQIKDEIDIEEWEMPIENPRSANIGCIPEDLQKCQVDDCDDLESTEVGADEVPVEEIQDTCNQQVFCQPLREATGSSDFKNCLSLEASEETIGNLIEGEGSSICTSQEIYGKNMESYNGIPENNLRCDVVPVDESLSTQVSKSILNVTKPGGSYLKDSLIKRKTGFICDICKKTFKQKLHLGRHVWVHYDERPFNCTVCDKRFKRDDVRYHHELLHLRDKMNVGESKKGSKQMLYSCALCAKNFSSRIGFLSHSNLHSNKYKCNSCGRCFGGNADLRKHLRTHTKEKPFKCEVCSKCFSVKSALNRHLLIHSTERPYICDICDKSFKSKREKTRHTLYHLRKK